MTNRPRREFPLVRWLAAVAAVACVGSGAPRGIAWADDAPATPPAEQIKPGETLDQSTWQKAQGLMPPEVLRHYEKGEYVNKVVEWKEGTFNWSPDFLAASEKNAGKFDLDADGGIVEKATGQQPARIFGYPFPKIDKDDPKAANKIVWNYFYITWFYGNLHAQAQVNWVSPKGLDRRSDQDVNFYYYEGQPEGDAPANPHNLFVQQLVVTRAPADLNGISALAWRYRDPRKRDSAWAYVPALRRIRSVSPSNRSDGFLGSDMSQDDGPFFDGKPEDFNWKLVGSAEQLRFVDPLNLQGKSNSKWMPEGGWRPYWPEDQKMLGYEDPSFQGVGWAPLSQALAKRKFWIVEGVPKDTYYLYGKLQLYIDQETFQGAWNRKFDWKGELLNTMQVIAYNLAKYTRPDGRVDYIQGSNMAYQCAENIKANRATVAGSKSFPGSALDVHAPFNAEMFTVDALSRVGK